MALLLVLLLTLLPTARSTGCSTDDECLQITDGNWRCLEAGFSDWQFAQSCFRDSDGGSSYCVCGKVECDVLDRSAAPRMDGVQQLLVVGDSISDAYFEQLKDDLGGEWQVEHALAYDGYRNNGNVNLGVHCIDAWLGDEPERWDVITL